MCNVCPQLQHQQQQQEQQQQEQPQQPLPQHQQQQREQRQPVTMQFEEKRCFRHITICSFSCFSTKKSKAY